MRCMENVKKFVAGILASLFFSLPAFSDITGVPGNIGNISRPNNTTTNINGGFVNGNNTLNHFENFGIDAGHTVNQYFTTGNAINLVKNHIDVNGVYNAFGNGNVSNIGGNVMFISPAGMAVGAGGVMNVGSMQMIVPTQAVYNSMASAFTNISNAYSGATPDINYNVNITNDLAAAFTNNLTNITNTENLSTSNKVEVLGHISASGLVEIAASGIDLSAAVNKSNINTLGEVNLIANTGNIVGSSNLNIESDGKITLTANNGNIQDVTLASKTSGSTQSATVKANAGNGSVSIESKNSNVIFEDVSAKDAISLKTTGSGKLTATNVVSTGQNVILTSAGGIDAQTIKSVTGITVNSGGAFNQLESGIIEATAGNITLEGITSGTLRKISASGEVKITSTGTTDISDKISGTSIKFNSGDITASTSSSLLEAEDISLVSSGSVGTESNAIQTSSKSGSSTVAGTIAGNSYINALNNANYSNIAANGNIKLTTTGTGKLIANFVESTTGNVILESAADADFWKINAKNVTITANGIVNHLNQGIINATGGDFVLSGATSGILREITATGNISVASSGTIQVSDTLKANSIDFNTGSISGSGTLDSPNITLASTGAIGTNAAALELTNTAGNVTVLASAANDIYIDSAKNTIITGLSGKNITLTSAGTIQSGAINGNSLVLTSNGNITQTASTLLNTTSNASLNSTNGDIIVSNMNSGGQISASANNGRIDITSQNKDAKFNNVTASNIVALKTTGSGNITATNVSSTSQNVNINSASGITVNKITAANGASLTAAGDVGINSNNSYFALDAGAGNASIIANAINQTGNNIAVNANNGITLSAASLGKTNAPLLLKSDSGKVTATTTTGDLLIGTKGANTINLSKINAGSHTFKFTGDTNSVLLANDTITAGTINISNLDSFTANNDYGAANVILTSINNATITKLTTTGSITMSDVSNILAGSGTINGSSLNISGLNSGVFGTTSITDNIIIATTASGGDITLNGTMRGTDVSLSGANILAGASGLLDASGNISLTATGSIGANNSALKLTNSSGNVNVIKAQAGVNNDIFLAAQKNAKVNNVSANNIQLSSTGTLEAGNINSAQDLSITATGNISQTAGTIISGGTAGKQAAFTSTNGNIILSNINTPSNIIANANGEINITSSSANLNVLSVQNSSGDITLSSSGTGNIALCTGAVLNAANDLILNSAGNLSLTGTLTAANEIRATAANNLSSGGILSAEEVSLTGAALDSTVLTTINSANNVNLTSTSQKIGNTGTFNIKTNAQITADGKTEIDLTSKSNNLNIKNAQSQGAIKLASDTSGKITVENASTTGSNVSINSASDAEIKDITAGKNITINTKTGLTHTGTLNQTESLNIQNTDSGNVILQNIMTATGKTATITNEADSMTAIRGTVTNDGTLTFAASSNGTNAGINFEKTASVTNSGSLTINNNGSKGTVLAGNFNNKLETSTINIENTNGDILIPQTNNDFSANHIANIGTIIMENSRTGKIDIQGAIKNDSTGVLKVKNSADGGLFFKSNALIDNYGELELVNNNGTFELAGSLNMLNNSKNTFTDGSENDLVISFKDLKNMGNDVTFRKEGKGKLIVDNNAKLANYKIGETGSLSLINAAQDGASGGGIVINSTAQLINGGIVDTVPYSGGIFNIINEGTGTSSDSGITINGNISNIAELNINNNAGSIDINSKITGVDGASGETVNILNNGTSININAEIANTENLLISNSATSTGSLKILGNLTNNTNVTLSNLNEENTGIDINTTELATNGLLTIENRGLVGINIASGKKITSKGGIKLINDNKGSKGITIAGTLENIETIPPTETALNPQAGHGIKIYNNQTNSTITNEGINISGTITSNAGVNEIINFVTADNSKITLTGNINTNSGIRLENYSSSGFDLQGIINNTVGSDVNVKGDIELIAHNSNLEIEHKLNPNDVYFNNSNGGIRMEIKGNGDILHTGEANGVGIVATDNIYLNTERGNVGVKDDVLDTARENGFSALDNSKSINVITSKGTINANAKNDGNAIVNVRTLNRDFVVGNIASDNIVLITAIDGNIISGANAGVVQTKDAYLYAGGTGSKININNAIINGKLFGETDGDINISSRNNGQKMDVDYLFSKTGSITLDVNGNSYIDAITAPKAISVTAHGSHLKFNNLGKFEAARASDIHPDDLALTVTAKNGLLEILNAYVRENVVLRADKIYANEHDTTATGFHSANQNGKMVVYDIQGYNYAQEVIKPPLSEWVNPNYIPQNDKKVLDLKLTIGKPVYDTALFGAQFDKVYTDIANINATDLRNALNERVTADFNFDSLTVNTHGRIQNNKYVIDVNNDTFQYDYQASGTLFTKLTGSFWLKMNENPEIQTCAPIIYYNNTNILNSPQTENSFQRLTHKSNKIEEDTTLESFRDRQKRTRSYKDRHDIRFSLLSNDYKILSSSTESGASVIDIRDISKGGMLVATDSMLKNGELVSVNFLYKGIPFDVKGEVVRAGNDLSAGVQFKEVDRFTSNLILYITMMSENL